MVEDLQAISTGAKSGSKARGWEGQLAGQLSRSAEFGQCTHVSGKTSAARGQGNGIAHAPDGSGVRQAGCPAAPPPATSNAASDPKGDPKLWPADSVKWGPAGHPLSCVTQRVSAEDTRVPVSPQEQPRKQAVLLTPRGKVLYSIYVLPRHAPYNTAVQDLCLGQTGDRSNVLYSTVPAHSVLCTPYFYQTSYLL